MSVTQEIKNRLDIVDIVSEQVPLRRSGRNYSGFCPFHTNTRTPAFYVFPETQTWHCFGECSEGGDLFSYVMKKEGWDFKEALKNLAKRAGVELEEPDPEVKRRRKSEDKLVDILSTAADYFHQLLLYAPQAEHARRYVEERGLTAETIETFCLGFALDSWDACRTHFNDQGYSDEELLKVGLLSHNPDKGTRYDRFRNRLMIPIRDVEGRVVGYGARTLEKEGIPKYLNSPQTELFDKGRLLYGLDTAKRNIREAREVVIVEGYMDVLQGWQAGFRNIVAQMGTALTGDQLRLLKRYTKRFLLALDPDAAGIKATMRSLQIARENLDREYESRFDARGLVQHEGRLQADILIATLPEGYDPDKLIRTNPEKWPQMLSGAKPVTAYVIDVVTKDLDLNDAKAKSAVAQQVLPLIKDIADPVEREHYRQQLARSLRVDERTLRMVQLPGEGDRGRQYVQPPPPPDEVFSFPGDKIDKVPGHIPSTSQGDKRVINLLRLCLEEPRLIIRINHSLLRQEQPPVGEDDFVLLEDGMILSLIYERADQGAVVTIEEMCDSLDSVLLERMDMILALPVSGETLDPRLPDKLAMSILDLRLAKAKAEIKRLEQLIRDAGDFERVTPNPSQLYLSRINELVLTVKWINRAKYATSASGQRRAEQNNGR
ncbi:MAG: DNA primase [Candidatus Promineifilaceae bacterium]|nr:DNA primase [Candidatus Promineifilaceae bacterium]